MNPYRHIISLRVSHPSIDPGIISEQLQYTPSRYWKAGDNRSTPKGFKLDGKYQNSYWSAGIHSEESILSETIDLKNYLSKIIQELEEHTSFFKSISSSGGKIELFIGMFLNDNSGLELPPTLLKEIGNKNIKLSFDIYPA